MHSSIAADTCGAGPLPIEKTPFKSKRQASPPAWLNVPWKRCALSMMKTQDAIGYKSFILAFSFDSAIAWIYKNPHAKLTTGDTKVQTQLRFSMLAVHRQRA